MWIDSEERLLFWANTQQLSLWYGFMYHTPSFETVYAECLFKMCVGLNVMAISTNVTYKWISHSCVQGDTAENCGLSDMLLIYVVYLDIHVLACLI